MRRALVLLPILALAAAGCGGLGRDATCAEWLDATAEEQAEFVTERARGKRVSREEVRVLATGTCRFGVRAGGRRVTADAAVRSAVRTLSPAPEF